MTTAVATRQNTALARTDQFTSEQVQLLKDTICQGATDDELSLFMHTSNRLQLDPFARQIFAVKRWDSKLRREVMTSQISIDGFRLVAERTGRYEGQDGPYWCDMDGKWTDVWLKPTPPKAAKVGVRKKGFEVPLYRTATWAEFAQTNKEGQLTPMWKKMGAVMLAKCAESQALRAAFPNELSGVYTQEEMAQEEVVTVGATEVHTTGKAAVAADIRRTAKQAKVKAQEELNRPPDQQPLSEIPTALQQEEPDPLPQAVSEPGDAAEPEPAAAGAFISEEKRRALFARANERDLQGDTKAELKKIIAYVKDIPADKASTTELTDEDFQKVCNELAEYPFKEAK